MRVMDFEKKFLPVTKKIILISTLNQRNKVLYNDTRIVLFGALTCTYICSLLYFPKGVGRISDGPMPNKKNL